MAKPNHDKALVFSAKYYQRLLAIYPKDYLRKFGPDMAQLFRDQCREAWTDAGGLGLAGLWCRVLPELVRTSLVEHLAAAKSWKPMLRIFFAMVRGDPRLRTAFLGVSAGVFLLMAGGGALLASLTPVFYAGIVQVAIGPRPEPSFDVRKSVSSELVLYPVISELGLRRKWGATERPVRVLGMREAYERLAQQLEVKVSRGTTLTEIMVFDADNQAAADLANAVAQSFTSRMRLPTDKTGHSPNFPLLVDMAAPNKRPSRPSRPLIIFEGIVWGIPLSLFLGVASAWLVFWKSRKVR